MEGPLPTNWGHLWCFPIYTLGIHPSCSHWMAKSASIPYCGTSHDQPLCSPPLGWMEPGGWKGFSPYCIMPLLPSQTGFVPLGPCCHTVPSGNLKNHGLLPVSHLSYKDICIFTGVMGRKYLMPEEGFESWKF